MSTFVDILYGKFIANEAGNPAVVNNRNTVTVNTGVTKVAFDTATTPAWNFTFCKDLYSASPARYFRGRDQIRILSFGIMLPYGMEFGDTIFTFGIGRSNYTGAAFSTNSLLPEFSDNSGANGYISVPFSNYEMALDVVSPFQAQNTGIPNYQMWYSIFGFVAAGNVSMVGMNSTLNATVQTPIPFIKVMHSIGLYNSTF